jgi:hypothetical protein
VGIFDPKEHAAAVAAREVLTQKERKKESGARGALRGTGENFETSSETLGPKKGMIALDMGMNPRAGGMLAEALFSSVQRRVLALLFGHPERSFQSAEVIRLVRGGTGGVHRELRRLEKAGWLTVARIGNQKHYQAHRACPGFHELHGLVVKTLGVSRSVGREAKPSPHRSPEPRPVPTAKRAIRPVPRPMPGPDEQRSPSASEPRLTPNDGWKAW